MMQHALIGFKRPIHAQGILSVAKAMLLLENSLTRACEKRLGGGVTTSGLFEVHEMAASLILIIEY